jgi:hypothetical protein
LHVVYFGSFTANKHFNLEGYPSIGKQSLVVCACAIDNIDILGYQNAKQCLKYLCTSLDMCARHINKSLPYLGNQG